MVINKRLAQRMFVQFEMHWVIYPPFVIISRFQNPIGGQEFPKIITMFKLSWLVCHITKVIGFY